MATLKHMFNIDSLRYTEKSKQKTVNDKLKNMVCVVH